MSTLMLRLVAILMAGVVIILGGIIFGYMHIYEGYTEEQALQYHRQITTDTADAIDHHFESLRESAEIMAALENLTEFAAGSKARRLSMRDTVRAQLSTYISYQSGVLNVFFRCTDGAWISAKPEDDNTYVGGVLQAFLHCIWDIPLSEPFRHTVYTDLYRSQLDTWYECMLVPVFRPIAAPRDSDYLGTLVIVCDVEYLQELLPASASHRTLLFSGDTLFFSSNSEARRQYQQLRSAMPTDEESLYTAETVDPRWSVLVLPEEESESLFVRDIRDFSLIIGALTILVMAVMSLLVYRAFVRPLLNIVSQISFISGFKQRLIPTRGMDKEYRKLLAAINSMLERIEHISDRAREATEAYYHERVLFLQTQINPHFLYNNMGCIRGMASMGKTAEIRTMTTRVADVYRYGSTDQPTATLREELACIGWYMEIIHLRYGNGFQLTHACDDETLAFHIPRMTLQPLVENAMLHGFLDARRTEGQISITAIMHKTHFTVRIQDNGAGISKDMLNRMRDGEIKSGKKSHIGLSNVQARMQYLFGDEATLTLESEEGHGSCVILRLPKN